MMIYRVIDKHILLFLELGVVLFKSSHYFTISNFWNSTIQELVYIEAIRYFKKFFVLDLSILCLDFDFRAYISKWNKKW